MSWTIYPAIDLRGGQCVRLFQGDYGQETTYGDPIEMARRWEKEGTAWLHLVDLDGAKVGAPVQMELIGEIAKNVKIPIQVGGGIRTLDTIEDYLNLGINRVILGTAALENEELLKQALSLNPEAIVVGIDARDGFVATRGWLDTSQVLAVELGQRLAELGVQTFIFTDIAKDGTLSGPNVEATQNFALKTKAKVIASGGVSSPEDLFKLKTLESDGVVGAIVGKALYTGKISLKEMMGK
ncbi:1-(5-phosphoribosyl)-5-[(5-phosphoribosylamino)methylideneamino]imidazole-4-carboxamide isomerase [Tepidibacillus infernus]|uniref:1-(5-phosphoribosyl)-5-[(5- phosphoribosylamino)methylideneamino]imidazole-4- carboxamide isomerase n=1 Tax=Tepidibacillus infernus TaxID=1806172 RepID=UPI003B71D437